MTGVTLHGVVSPDGLRAREPGNPQEDFFIDNLLFRIHVIIEMIWWTGLAPWEFELPFPGGLISTFLAGPCTWDS